jgi:cell envelope opacity-associated protein A
MPTPTPPEQPPKPSAPSSQSFGNITISGSNNPFAATQAGGDVTINQSSDRTQVTNTDLQSALAAITQLKQNIATSADLNPIEKATAEVPIKMLESELQKPQPDKNLVEQAIAALKKGLDGVVSLAEPVTKVATLVAKAWTGLI